MLYNLVPSHMSQSEYRMSEQRNTQTPRNMINRIYDYPSHHQEAQNVTRLRSDLSRLTMPTFGTHEHIEHQEHLKIGYARQ